MNLSVVIPSKTLSNVVPCIGALMKNEPDIRVIVVDDGIDGYFTGPKRLERISGTKPFIFARNVNLGINAAGNDDVVILNDDAILETPNGFTLLQDCAADPTEEYGIIGATTNNVGNGNQRPKGIGLREDPRMVCFIAVLIPRRTIDTVGLLDERFTAYGFDDDDYCLRVRKAGLKIGIHDGCFVDHASLKSTFRGEPRTAGSLKDGRQIFVEKWGSHPL